MQEVASRQGCIEGFQQDCPGLEVFGRSEGPRRQMFQRRGSGLNVVSVALHYGHAPGVVTALTLFVPRNSTQLISISSLFPSADSGRSSSKLRSTNGPVSRAMRRIATFDSSVSATSIMPGSLRSGLHYIMFDAFDSVPQVNRF